MSIKVMRLDKITLGNRGSTDRRGQPGLSPEGMPTPTDFRENKEQTKETEEMTFQAGRNPKGTYHAPSEREHFQKEGVACQWGIA